MSEWEVQNTEPISTQWAVDKDQPKSESWADVGKSAAHNFLPSVGRTVKDMVHPIIHPIETAQNMGHLLRGSGEKLKSIYQQGIGAPDTTDPQEKKYPEAIGQFLADRYGGMENLKHTMSKDPAGFLMDISTLLSGGETTLARAPGVLGKVGEVAGTTSRMTNPLVGPAKTMAWGAEKIAPGLIGDMATHTGADSLIESAKAGYHGGSAQEKLIAQMTGTAPASDVRTEALKGIEGMQKARRDAYQKDIGPILQDPTVLDFRKVDQAFNNVSGVKTFKGQTIAPASTVRKAMKNIVKQWKRLNPAEYHTVAGFDFLKQKLWTIAETTEEGTPERKIAMSIYNGVKKSITDQAPEYGKVMEEYETASKELDEVKRELSLNEKATTGTALRKLQSIMRNNASTANRHRKELGQGLVESGATDLMPMLAGQALEPRFARGLGRLVPTALGGGAAEAALSGHHSAAAGLGLAAGATAVSSPRLMGQAANKAGMAARPFKYVPPDKASLSLFQAGRMDSPLDNVVEQGLNKKKDQPWVPISE
jgi:hypothetical protein